MQSDQEQCLAAGANDYMAKPLDVEKLLSLVRVWMPTMKRSVPVKTEDIELELLLEAIYRKYHYDFRGYSKASLKRRLSQARDRFQCQSLLPAPGQGAARSGRVAPTAELAHGAGQRDVPRPLLFSGHPREGGARTSRRIPRLKVWVAGCSAGEELYSFAILFREEGLENRTLFYGTDINTDALKKAEAGVYELDRIALFTENHRRCGGKSSLSDYYTAAYRAAAFDKSLRQRVVFSDHSLVSDAVFAEVQLVSCRNVLIYFERELQDRAIGLFKDSLVRKGFLGLGAKETLRFSCHAAAFSDFVLPERIYQKEGEQ